MNPSYTVGIPLRSWRKPFVFRMNRIRMSFGFTSTDWKFASKADRSAEASAAEVSHTGTWSDFVIGKKGGDIGRGEITRGGGGETGRDSSIWCGFPLDVTGFTASVGFTDLGDPPKGDEYPDGVLELNGLFIFGVVEVTAEKGARELGGSMIESFGTSSRTDASSITITIWRDVVWSNTQRHKLVSDSEEEHIEMKNSGVTPILHAESVIMIASLSVTWFGGTRRGTNIWGNLPNPLGREIKAPVFTDCSVTCNPLHGSYI